MCSASRAIFALLIVGLSLAAATPSFALDQNLGGVLMSTEQAVVFGAAIVWLLIRLFREETEAEERLAAEQRAAGLRQH